MIPCRVWKALPTYIMVVGPIGVDLTEYRIDLLDFALLGGHGVQVCGFIVIIRHCFSNIGDMVVKASCIHTT
jgi:hypothetical protein